MSDTVHAIADHLHAVADQHRARDVALAHSHDERAAALRDTIASLIAADEASTAERNTRFADQIAYLSALRDAENDAALTQRKAAVAALTAEIDFHTKASDQVAKGEMLMPVAVQLRSGPEPEPINTAEFEAAMTSLGLMPPTSPPPTEEETELHREVA